MEGDAETAGGGGGEGAGVEGGSAGPVGMLADDLFRREGARLVAALTAHLGTHRLQLAEDVVQEALVRAMQTWPYRGVPSNPAAWLTQTAKNLALDRLRREQRWQEKADGIALARERWLSGPGEGVGEEGGGLDDDTLRLMFVCFHPRLSAEAQVALALRTLCGFGAGEIASAFLMTEAAVAKRLVRTRQRIRELALPFAVPSAEELPGRLDGVLSTLYLLFNEGYKASGGERLVRGELCAEAIRLVRLLVSHPVTGQPRTHALLSLMLLGAARLPARTDGEGRLRRLHEQDRGVWDVGMIVEGIRHLGLAATGEALSEYHLEAGIAACHSTAVDDAATDWGRILSLYDRLWEMRPTPVVALNRAIAVSKVRGVEAGLVALAAIRGLGGYLPYHAAVGAMEAELGRRSEAVAAFRRAERLAVLSSERGFLAGRIAELEAGGV